MNRHPKTPDLCQARRGTMKAAVDGLSLNDQWGIFAGTPAYLKLKTGYIIASKLKNINPLLVFFDGNGSDLVLWLQFPLSVCIQSDVGTGHHFRWLLCARQHQRKLAMLKEKPI